MLEAALRTEIDSLGDHRNKFLELCTHSVTVVGLGIDLFQIEIKDFGCDEVTACNYDASLLRTLSYLTVSLELVVLNWVGYF